MQRQGEERRHTFPRLQDHEKRDALPISWARGEASTLYLTLVIMATGWCTTNLVLREATASSMSPILVDRWVLHVWTERTRQKRVLVATK